MKTPVELEIQAALPGLQSRDQCVVEAADLMLQQLGLQALEECMAAVLAAMQIGVPSADLLEPMTAMHAMCLQALANATQISARASGAALN